jgi:cytochrome oxidase Cu insertion factor (SCO1/SenC/PrrC family)
MLPTSARKRFRLRIVFAGLAILAGCGRAPSVNPSTEPETASGLLDAPPGDIAQAKIADEGDGACCEKGAVASRPQDKTAVKVEPLPAGVKTPDVTLVNQDGRRVRFRSDLVKGKIVAVNFIFTSCKGICPPMGANFAQLQKRLGDRVQSGVELISISVDPRNDTPERLREWRKSFGGRPGWTLLTGEKQEVDLLLKQMGVFAADKTNHSPFILVGDAVAGKWTRVHGLTAADRLAEIIAGMHEEAIAAKKSASIPLSENHSSGASSTQTAGTPAQSPAEKYFTNVELVNQHGKRVRLYADLLKGKVVVINSFFSTCKGSCPVMLSSFSKIQQHFADRIGADLWLISITVDPQTDTPEILAALANHWKAKPGWQFLTGDKASVDAALYKLGQYAENKESHSNIFIIGKEATGLWKKARGLSGPEAIIPLIDEVLADKL